MSHTLDRPGYDAWLQAELEETFTGRPEALARAIERQYPRDDEAVSRELRFRGFNAETGRLMDSMARALELVHVGGLRVWFQSDVDALAERYAEMGDRGLTHPAIHAKESGRTWHEYHAAEQREWHAWVAAREAHRDA